MVKKHYQQVYSLSNYILFIKTNLALLETTIYCINYKLGTSWATSESKPLSQVELSRVFLKSSP